MKIKLAVIICSLTLSTLLSSCATIDEMTLKKNEANCNLGTDCYRNLSPSERDSVRKQLLMERQGQQRFDAETGARAYGLMRSTQSE